LAAKTTGRQSDLAETIGLEDSDLDPGPPPSATDDDNEVEELRAPRYLGSLDLDVDDEGDTEHATIDLADEETAEDELGEPYTPRIY
jgi:hypothetical protein